MRLRNTSHYPTDEVRALVAFATKGVQLGRVAIHVKNTRGSVRGMAYKGVPVESPRYRQKTVDRLITIGIGRPESFPANNMMPAEMVWRRIGQTELDTLNPEWAARFVRWTIYNDGRPAQASVRAQGVAHPYGGKRSPLIEYHDWREGLVAVAAHEARHVQQFQRSKPCSEVDAERHAAKMLARYREGSSK